MPERDPRIRSGSTPVVLTADRRPVSMQVGGQGSFNPLTVTGLVEWLNGDDITENNGVEITTWTARFGTNAAGQGTAKPTALTSGVGGKKSARFTNASGSHFTLSTPAALGTQANYYFLAIKNAGVQATGHHFLDNQTNRNLVGCATSNDNYTLFAGSSVSAAGQDTSSHVILAIFNAASSVLYEDGGTAVVAANAGSQGASGTWFIGAGNNGAAGVLDDSAIRHVLAIHGSPTNATLDQIGRYFASDIGTTWTAIV